MKAASESGADGERERGGEGRGEQGGSGDGCTRACTAMGRGEKEGGGGDKSSESVGDSVVKTERRVEME